MISDLSREADRSMLGLQKKVIVSLLFVGFSVSRSRSTGSFDVLLHGGGQAGDPAILQQKVSGFVLDDLASIFDPRQCQVRMGVNGCKTYVALQGALEDQLFSHGDVDEGDATKGRVM